MAEAQKTAKADALMNKAQMQKSMAQARAQSAKAKHMINKPKPRLKSEA
uniref:Uncharacterized protein n=1 Tax=Magnetococcus massalia (strain MO-1) TaxID=451514 RepID=A0A1S7LM93_MAGMO|nr:Protein of unknown function [Candidatus Magnetococcus massalia]